MPGPNGNPESPPLVPGAAPAAVDELSTLLYEYWRDYLKRAIESKQPIPANQMKMLIETYDSGLLAASGSDGDETPQRPGFMLTDADELTEPALESPWLKKANGSA